MDRGQALAIGQPRQRVQKGLLGMMAAIKTGSCGLGKRLLACLTRIPLPAFGRLTECVQMVMASLSRLWAGRVPTTGPGWSQTSLIHSLPPSCCGLASFYINTEKGDYRIMRLTNSPGHQPKKLDI